MFALAHLSDLHAAPARAPALRELADKRLLAWLSWTTRRHREHRGEVLDALLADLARVGPDHVAVTGDLTNLGLATEFAAAAAWLRRLGSADAVSVVPGNHDVTVATPHATTWEPWRAWLRPLAPARPDGPTDRAGNGSRAGADDRAHEHVFPSVRRAGPLALVLVSSAVATPPLLATGRVGRAQCERLEAALRALGREDAFRVVLVHHPPLPVESWRRRLTDAPALRGALARAGAELVLHGHAHTSHFGALEGPCRPIPVVGVSSASALGRGGAARRARWHLYRIDPDSGRVACAVRRLAADGGGFEVESERVL